MSTPDSLAKANKLLAGKLALLTIAMFGFGFALIPLYQVFCEITGINGKTGRIDVQAAQLSQVDDSRWVTVEFTGQVVGALSWEFKPLTRKLRVHPGSTAVVKYYAHNMSGDTVTGQAVPSVSPTKAAAYFKKIECFCFDRQELKSGESREMAVSFVVQRGLPRDVKTLTLSYSFFKVDNAQARGDRGHLRTALNRGRPTAKLVPLAEPS